MALKPFPFRSAVLIAVIMLFVVQNSVAQYSRRSGSGDRNTWEFGFTGGASQFLNSINPNSDAFIKKFNYWNANYNAAITLSIIKNFSSKFSAEFEFLTTKLSGSWNENNGYEIPPQAIFEGLQYPLPFKTGINQFTINFVPNLNKIFAPNSLNEKWYLFLKGGIGATFLKEYSGLYPYNKPGNGFEYALVYGGGLSYTINEKIKFKLGATWYRIDTDRLDGVHSLKPNGDITKNESYYYNVKEKYLYPYIGMTYGFGQIQSKAHFIRGNNSKFLWFKSSKKYRKRR